MIRTAVVVCVLLLAPAPAPAKPAPPPLVSAPAPARPAPPLLCGSVEPTPLAGAASANAGNRLSVAVDRTEITTSLGSKVELRSTITNHGATAARGLVAHLNVLSFRGDVYVDPEDWSAQRTRYLEPIPARGSTTLTWRISAVNSGSIGVYVAVLPQSGEPVPPTTGPTVRLAIGERRTLNSGGILPLALGVPALLGALTLGLRLRRRG